MNIASSSRNIAKLDVNSRVQAHELVKFTQYAKILGNGLVVIDFSSRVGNIQNSYKVDDNWERELFIESSSFAISAATGTSVVSVGGSALSFLVVATPMGWVGLIAGGMVVAGIAAASSVVMNDISKSKSGDLYDKIMKSLSEL